MHRRLWPTFLFAAPLLALVPFGCGDEPGRALAVGCTLTSDCAEGLLCSFGRCHAACKTSRDCPTAQRCTSGNGGNVCQLPDESSCTYTSECASGLRCAVDSQCRAPCIANSDCFVGGQLCVDGTCADPSELDDAGALPHDGSATPDEAGADSSQDAASEPEVVPHGPEDCSNGLDDDGDNLIDCLDPDCTAYQCAPPLPVGWTGPVVLFDGPTAGAPSCTPPFASQLYLGHRDVTCAPATCPCTCATPTGRTCSQANLFMSSNVCPRDNVNQYLDGTCQVTVGNAVASSGLNSGSPGGGSCVGIPGVATKTAPDWGTTGRVCGGAGFFQGGCATGALCVPKASDPFSRTCVLREGEIDCPAAGFSEKHVFYADLGDTRGCGTCTCGGANGGTCLKVADFYSDACNTMIASLDLSAFSTPCTTVVFPTHVKGIAQVTNPGSCSPNPPAKTGMCTPSQPTTVCCVPPP